MALKVELSVVFLRNFSRFTCVYAFFVVSSDTALAINTTTQYTSLIANSPVATFAQCRPCYKNSHFYKEIGFALLYYFYPNYCERAPVVG